MFIYYKNSFLASLVSIFACGLIAMGVMFFVDAIHYTKGEGIEKKEENFADEVAAQIAGAGK